MNSIKNTALAKVLSLVVITIILCIPLAQIGSLINERGDSQHQAAAELANTYAGQQTLLGPFIVVPYVEHWIETTPGEKGAVIRTARTREGDHFIYPKKLDLSGALLPEERYRGIFRVLFYKLRASITGTLPPLDTAGILRKEKDSRIETGTPYFALALGDMRGIEGMPSFKAAGESLKIAQRIPAASSSSWLSRGIHAPLTGEALKAFGRGDAIAFTFALNLTGHEKLSVAPLADETTAHLTSPWPHPAFGGRFLASERTIGDHGFEARWAVSSLVSEARGQIGKAQPDGRPRPELDTFDVSLMQPLNVYAMTNRAVKYGLLFVGLTLMAAFMFELLRKLRMHPVQYALVGLSIALFFLLLLALSEKMVFWLAYTCAASASVLLLAVYFSAVLQGWRRGVSLAAYVGVLYAALYGLLASESNALLLGALLMFGMLALLMIATRRVDWYSLGPKEGEAAATPPAAPPAMPRPAAA